MISTVDVYPNPKDVDENSLIDTSLQHAYGKHRYELENFVENNFDSLIVRLPGLFGKGIKKNIIYDFLHNNQINKIHKDSAYQFYYLDDLWNDIKIAQKMNLKVVNFATCPTSVEEIASKIFGLSFDNVTSNPACYDFKSKYDSIYQGKNGYMYSKDQILQKMNQFVKRERGE